MTILKNEALMMGRGIVIVTRDIGQELYPLIDDIHILRVIIKLLYSCNKLKLLINILL